MNAALLTVGDELLAGDIENTNATWLARQLTDRGVSVERITVVPDEVDTIAEYVRTFAGQFDAVVVTGGLGGTPDDVTMDGVAAAFDRPLAVDEEARADIERSVAAYQEANPDRDVRVNVERHASLPEGARALINGDGLSPGCVVENVYVVPGIPREMKAMFADVADEFTGEVRSRTLHTPLPESDVTPFMETAREDLPDAVLGSYPSREGTPNRIKITAESDEAIDEAEAWLCERIDVQRPPEDGGDETGEE
ncbi:competence/damage-inducible protein A [Halomarina litorea]|uniref:competence/damage-inducible protein A n=1 Tax=Halomarina litorea TaxID=2961595 RepID=UPI0020C1F9DB|nr:molybdopterin-binding protein [Halomarina sp. BCD28]